MKLQSLGKNLDEYDCGGGLVSGAGRGKSMDDDDGWMIVSQKEGTNGTNERTEEGRQEE